MLLMARQDYILDQPRMQSNEMVFPHHALTYLTSISNHRS
jgi:hypothetical protein